jgi:CBS domain-containing protein
MSRTDTPLDGMLRHLGAAYYDSLHGRAAMTDVVRALDCVAERIHEQPAGLLAATRALTRRPPATGPHHHDLWHSRVRDIMTTPVVTVEPGTTCRQISAVLSEHEIRGVPVVADGHVAGVVSADDLIAATDSQRRGRRQQLSRRQQSRLTAAQVMSAPVVTIQPDATISAAARLMSARHVRRLPVVDDRGHLTGIVSHRDLLSLFLRSDAEIAWQATQMLAQILPTDPGCVQAAVRDGIVTLTAAPGLHGRPDLLSLATRLAWDVDGVVDVTSGTSPAPAEGEQERSAALAAQ